ncbi:MAG TPA: CoA transferase, partial [Acidimicrobiia bacterium]|nr:CoA transferase [Acidimicrobiia bacterium]
AMLVDGVGVPRPRLDADQTGFGPTDRLYRTNDGWIQIAAVKDEHWRGLCAAVGQPDLADDARFATPAARAEHRQQLEALLAPAFAGGTAVVWSRVLDDHGVPNEVPVDTLAGRLALFDADNERLGLVAEYEHPVVGTMRQYGRFFDFSATPTNPDRPPPRVGEDTKDILEELGYDAARMDDLKNDNVVYWPDENYSWTV